MPVRLNKGGFEFAKGLIREERVVLDERDAWSEHQPSAEKENEFIRSYGFEEYGKGHLGINDEKDKQTKARYEFAYGDFERVHRCAVLSAESRHGNTSIMTSNSQRPTCMG